MSCKREITFIILTTKIMSSSATRRMNIRPW